MLLCYKCLLSNQSNAAAGVVMCRMQCHCGSGNVPNQILYRNHNVLSACDFEGGFDTVLLLSLHLSIIQCLAKVFGPLELCDLLPHFRLQT